MTPPERQSYDQRQSTGAFDIIGDVHSCADELEDLLALLGYSVTWDRSAAGDTSAPQTTAPLGRRVVFVGDLVDRGPRAADAMAIVMALCERGQALCVPGNHDAKFRRWLDGHAVTQNNGLELTASEFRRVSAKRRADTSQFLRLLPPYLWLDAGKLVVAHAGIQAGMIGHVSHEIENFCLYGDVEKGRTYDRVPKRYNWAARYDGSALVVYGHTPVSEPAWVNGTVCVDTGCCFGGSLTAFRYPERECVAVPARRPYAEKGTPFGLPPVRS